MAAAAISQHQTSENEALASVISGGVDDITVQGVRAMRIQATGDGSSFAVGVNNSKAEDSGKGAVVPPSLVAHFAGSNGVLMVSTVEHSSFNGVDNGTNASPSASAAQGLQVVTSPVSVRLALDGAFANVNGLQEPILVTVLATRQEGVTCAYYNEETLEWSEEGVWDHNPDGESLVCATTHLSIFGAIQRFIQGLSLAVICSPPELLTATALGHITEGHWWRRAAAFVLWSVTIMQIWVVWTAHKFDMESDHCFWCDECFLMDRPGFKAVKTKWYAPILDGFQLVRSFTASPSGVLSEFFAAGCIQSRVAREMQLLPEEVTLLLDWARKYTGTIADPEASDEEKKTGQQDADVTWDAWLERAHPTKHKALPPLTPSPSPPATTESGDGGPKPRNSLQGHIEGNQGLLQTGYVPMLFQQGYFETLGAQPMDSEFARVKSRNLVKQDWEVKVSAALTLALAIHNRMQHEVNIYHQKASKRKLAVDQFMGTQPWAQVRRYSITKPASDRALLVTCKLLGALAAASYSIGITAFSTDSDDQCSPPEDLMVALGKTVGISIMSLVVGTVPNIVFGMLHARTFIYKEQWTDELRSKQLGRWRLTRRILWIVAPLYALFCLLYCISFIANVSLPDANKWFNTNTLTVFKMGLLIPLAIAVAYALIGATVASRMVDLAVRSKVRDKLLVDAPVKEAWEPSDGPAPPPGTKTPPPPPSGLAAPMEPGRTASPGASSPGPGASRSGSPVSSGAGRLPRREAWGDGGSAGGSALRGAAKAKP